MRLLIELVSLQVVVYFYPSDNSPGCTKQANAFKSSFSDFKSKGAQGTSLHCFPCDPFLKLGNPCKAQLGHVKPRKYE